PRTGMGRSGLGNAAEAHRSRTQNGKWLPSPGTMTVPSDQHLGSLTDDGPWVLDPATIRWLPVVPAVRWAVQHQIPALVRPGRLPPGTRVARVLWHLGTAVGVWALRERPQGGTASRAGISRRLRRAAEALGP